MEYLEIAVDVGPVVIAIASAVAAVTPTPRDNVAVGWLRKVLSVLALNIGAAKPAAEVVAEQNRAARGWGK